MRDLDDLSGNDYGIWHVEQFSHMNWNGNNHKHGMSYYFCKCKECGAIKRVSRSQLLQAKNISHSSCGVKST